MRHFNLNDSSAGGNSGSTCNNRKSNVSGIVVAPPRLAPADSNSAELGEWSGTPLDKKNKGAFLLEGTLVCEVAPPQSQNEAILALDQTDVEFIRSGQVVELHWMDRSGKPRSYGEIGIGSDKRQATRPGAVWLITDRTGKHLGHFRVDDRTAQAVIPAVPRP